MIQEQNRDQNSIQQKMVWVFFNMLNHQTMSFLSCTVHILAIIKNFKSPSENAEHAFIFLQVKGFIK